MEETFEKQCSVTPRRSERPKKPSLKGLEYISTVQLQTNKNLFDVSSESEDENCESPEKPTILHENDTITGDKIFTFQYKKKCEAILNKPQVTEVVPKTPHTFRNKIKEDIKAKIMEQSEPYGSDFSDIDIDYTPSMEESESEESTSSSDSDISHDEPLSTRNKPKVVNLPSNYQETTKRLNKNYTIKTDDYFSNHSTNKVVTSNHTLDKLETARLPQDQLQKLLSKNNLHKNHQIAMDHLKTCAKSNFSKWLFLTQENINILVYGLGSKKNIINLFHEECLKSVPTIVVNGFFPSLTIKDILDGIIVELLELKGNPSNIYEACDLIEKEFSYIPDTHLYLIVHNIDMIRSSKAQNIFARLAAVNNIHLIASIDHINAPLIWDHSKLSKFNFTWWDITSFQPYTDETSFESSMLVQRTGTLALSSLRNIFLSLTSNSKGIYLILVKYQIENGKNQYYQGLAFKDLYLLCREAFLVSSDLALRTQLSEFVDHKMVKFKRSPDGTEYLIIPISNALLQQFLNEQTS